MDLTPVQMALAAAAMAVGAVVQGSVGFGAAVLAAPVVLLVDPRFVPGPMILAGLVLTCLIAMRERAAVDVRGIAWALVGRVPGSGLGVLVLLWVPPDSLQPVVAAMILIAVALAASGLRVEPRRGTLFGAGVASGVLGTIASVGGPPVALVYQHAPGPTLRGTMASYFIFSSSISLVALLAAGLFGMRELFAALVLLPGVVVGFVLSAWTHTLLDRGYMRPAVLALSTIAAVGVLVQGV